MALTEYLYTDDTRIDAYVEQIGPPIKYEKVPKWSTELSLTGPKVGATQERHARSLTRHEKIICLLDHLQQNKLVASDRLSGRGEEDFGEGLPFVHETTEASRVLIPRRDDQRQVGLALWVSAPEHRSPRHLIGPRRSSVRRRKGVLCLLEDFKKSDSAPYDGYAESAYTILEGLILSIGDQMNNLLLAEAFPQLDSEEAEDRMEAWEQAIPHMGKFAKNPTGLLKDLGCRITKRRKIRTLYRVREYGAEAGDGHTSISVFGYPIFIAAEG